MASAAAKPEPRRIGGYVVGARIAVGGMAEVFLGCRVADGMPCVLKVLLPRSARDEATVQGLAHEAELARSLVHPGIVRAFELVTDGDVTALVLELVDGAPLDAFLERKDPIDPALAIHIVCCLLDALAFVHGARDATGRALEIVHRDVSPHNVLLSREGDVKLVDFGIARSALRDQRTRTGLVKGKLQYLSPEQATGSEVDARTDVYAVGLILYELLTRRPCLRGDSDVDVLREAEAPTYVPIGRAEVDARLDGLLKKALARFPEERFASTKAFRAALEPFAPPAAEGRASLAAIIAAMVPPLVHEAPKHVPPSAPARRVYGLVLATTLALAAVALYATRASAPRPPPIAPRPPSEVTTLPVVRAEDAGSPIGAVSRLDASTSAPRLARDAGRRDPVIAVPIGTPDADVPRPVIPQAILSRRARFVASLASRGLEREDLGIEAVHAWAELEGAIAMVDAARAEALLVRLEGILAGTRVDAQLVRRRMARIDARIVEARARGEDTRAVEALSRDALEAFVDGRHDVANARITEIERALTRAR